MSAPVLDLVHPQGGTARVHRYGAHVTSWRTADGRERLFLARRAALDGSAAIRGGVPVIFPQFAGEGPLPKHGFARTAEWDVLEQETAAATLELRDSEATRAIWPHSFVARLQVRLGADALAITLAVRNAGADELAFTAALHTYLATSDARGTAVRGLDGVAYRDSTAGGAVRRQVGDVTVEGEVNRIYLATPEQVEVISPDEAITVEQAGFRDIVVWNPGRPGAAALPDMDPDEADRMLCVEAAVIGDPVRLAAGAEWSGTQRLSIAGT